MKEIRDTYKIFVGRPEIESSLWRHTRRQKENIKADLNELVRLLIGFV
jgi:hypothetical protein